MAHGDDNGNGNGRVKVSVGTLIQLVAYLAAIGMVWVQLSDRIARLEERTVSQGSDITEIKGDVKRLLRNRERDRDELFSPRVP